MWHFIYTLDPVFIDILDFALDPHARYKCPMLTIFMDIALSDGRDFCQYCSPIRRPLIGRGI
jgi:hypothetical protein